MMGESVGRLTARPGWTQAVYYVASGLWPLLSYRTFEAVTGSKREAWLVKTVGLVTAVIGVVLATDPAGRVRQTRLLGVGAAGAYAAIDVWYAGVRRRLRPVYLLDAVAEAAFVAVWMRSPRR